MAQTPGRARVNPRRAGGISVTQRAGGGGAVLRPPV